MKRWLSAAGFALSTAASVVGVAVQTAQWAGVEFGGVAARLSETSYVWLPMATFLLGMFVGFFVCRKIDGWMGKRVAGHAARRPERAPADAPDPLAGLVPVERELLLRVYDEAAVRVERDVLQAARSLNAKGLVYRLGLEGDRRAVIQGCDVVLADGVAALLDGRADELREQA